MKINKLQELIQSLSRNEKIYVKRELEAFKKENKYVQVFNYYLKPTTKKLSFQKDISVIKSQLFKLILKHLRQFHAKSNSDFTLQNQLQEADILIKKNLIKEAKKIVNKTIIIANEQENFLVLQKAYLSLFKIASTHNFLYCKKGDLEEYYNQLKNIQNKTSNEFTHRYLSLKLFYNHCKFGEPRNKKEFAFYHKICDELNQIPHLTLRGKYVYFNINSFIYGLDENYKASENALKNALELFNTNKFFTSNNLDIYIAVVNNLSFFLAYQNKFSKADEVINRLEVAITEYKIPIKSALYYTINNQFLSFKLFLYYKENKNEEIITTLLPKIENYLKLLPNNDWYHFYFLYYLARFNYEASRLPIALKWINVLLQINAKEVALHIQCFATLLKAIILFELNETDQLEYFIKNTSYFLNKQQRNFKIETEIIIFLKTSIKRQLTQNDMDKLSKKIATLLKDTHEKRATDFINFDIWLNHLMNMI